MPLHRIYTAKGVFSAEDKQAIAERITSIYNRLPKFYVVVVFLEVEPENFHIGGRPNARFVRIVSQHFARTKQQAPAEDEMVDDIQEALAPYVRERSLDWESHIEWMERSSCREYGLPPPPPSSEAEKH